MELTCAGCLLRPLALTDAESLVRHGDDREIWLNLRDRFPSPYTIGDAVAYLAHVQHQAPQTTFGIDVGGAIVGSVSIRPGDDIERVSAEIGYWLGRAFWGRGIMTEVVRAVTGYAFGVLGLRRIFALPFARNVASHRVLEKAGYELEGVLRRSAVKDGELLDQRLYAAYDDRWLRE